MTSRSLFQLSGIIESLLPGQDIEYPRITDLTIKGTCKEVIENLSGHISHSFSKGWRFSLTLLLMYFSIFFPVFYYRGQVEFKLGFCLIFFLHILETSTFSSQVTHPFSTGGRHLINFKRNQLSRSNLITVYNCVNKAV